MDLQKFVKETLEQIVNGVKDAQNTIKESGAVINPKSFDSTTDLQNVKFNIAVTVEEASEGGADGRIRILGNTIGGGGKLSSSEAHASRVEFEVQVRLPGQEDQKRIERPMPRMKTGIV